MTPSSLTLSTGRTGWRPCAAVVLAPSTTPPASRSSDVGGAGWRPPPAGGRPIRHRRAVQRGQRRQHARIQIGNRAPLEQMQQLAPRRHFASSGAERRGSAGRVDRSAPPAAAATSGSRTTTNSAPSRVSARSRAVWKICVASAASPTASAQRRYFACTSTQVPRRPAERKQLAPSAKILISRDGLSTAQTCACWGVARACGWNGLAHGT